MGYLELFTLMLALVVSTATLFYLIGVAYGREQQSQVDKLALRSILPDLVRRYGGIFDES